MWIQNNLGGQGACLPPPLENFEINGAIWCVLGPPESFLDQLKSCKGRQLFKKYYGMVYDLGCMIYKVFSVVIIRSGERGWISNHIFLLKKLFCQNNVDSAAYSRIGSYAPVSICYSVNCLLHTNFIAEINKVHKVLKHKQISRYHTITYIVEEARFVSSCLSFPSRARPLLSRLFERRGTKWNTLQNPVWLGWMGNPSLDKNRKAINKQWGS